MKIIQLALMEQCHHRCHHPTNQIHLGILLPIWEMAKPLAHLYCVKATDGGQGALQESEALKSAGISGAVDSSVPLEYEDQVSGSRNASSIAGRLPSSLCSIGHLPFGKY